MSSLLNFAAVVACYSRLVFSCVLHARIALALARVEYLGSGQEESGGEILWRQQRHVDGLHGRQGEPLLGPRPQAGQAVRRPLMRLS